MTIMSTLTLGCSPATPSLRRTTPSLRRTTPSCSSSAPPPLLRFKPKLATLTSLHKNGVGCFTLSHNPNKKQWIIKAAEMEMKMGMEGVSESQAEEELDTESQAEEEELDTESQSEEEMEGDAESEAKPYITTKKAKFLARIPKKQMLVLKFIWMEKNIGIALDQAIPGHGTVPLSLYYFWPRKDAWEELKAVLESKPWISQKRTIILLNQATDIINLWQQSGSNI